MVLRPIMLRLEDCGYRISRLIDLCAKSGASEPNLEKSLKLVDSMYEIMLRSKGSLIPEPDKMMEYIEQIRGLLERARLGRDSPLLYIDHQKLRFEVLTCMDRLNMIQKEIHLNHRIFLTPNSRPTVADFADFELTE